MPRSSRTPARLKTAELRSRIAASGAGMVRPPPLLDVFASQEDQVEADAEKDAINAGEDAGESP